MKILISLFICTLSFGSIIPKSFTEDKSNTYSIGPDELLGSEITQEIFYEVVTQVYSLYKGNSKRNIIVKTLDWNMPYFSAWAFYDDTTDEFSINFWGGFARLPDMTKRSFILTACHEVGHVLGGRPYHKNKHHSHMSAEGQADYFASAICFKKYLDHYELSEVEGLDPYATSKCLDSYSKEKDFNKCLQVAKAGQDMGSVLTYLSFDSLSHTSYATPDQTVVEETIFDSYPNIQCRVDTYLAGSTGSSRPNCWFSTEE